MKRDMQQEEEHEASDNKISNLSEHIKAIKETYSKLVEDRNKAKTAI